MIKKSLTRIRDYRGFPRKSPEMLGRVSVPMGTHRLRLVGLLGWQLGQK